jgi:LuxR family maltose regulon positive regulatory protein
MRRSVNVQQGLRPPTTLTQHLQRQTGIQQSLTPDESLQLLPAGALSLVLRLINKRCITRQQCLTLCPPVEGERWITQLCALNILQPMTELTHVFRVNPLVARHVIETLASHDILLVHATQFSQPTQHLLSEPDALPFVFQPHTWLARYLLIQARHWLLLGHTRRALWWLHKHPQHHAPKHPQHQLLLLSTLVYDCQYTVAEHLLTELRQNWEKQFSWPAKWRQKLTMELAAIELLLDIFQRDLNAISPETSQRLKRYLDAPTEQQAMLQCVYTFLLFMNGRHDKALFYASQATRSSQATSNPFTQAIAVLLTCLCDRAIGRFDLALRNIESAHHNFARYEDTPAWSCIALVQALFLYEIDNLAEARDLLTRALPQLGMSPITEFNVHGYLTLCRAQAMLADTQVASLATTSLQSRLPPQSLERWSASLQHEQARLALLQQQPQQAKLLAKPSLEDGFGGCAASRTRYCPAVGHVPSRTALMIALFERDYDAAQDALGQLSQVCLLHQDNSLRIILLSSTATYELGQGNTEEAMEYLNHALRLAQNSGMFRALFDEVFGFGEVFNYGLTHQLIEEDIHQSLVEQLTQVTFCQPAQRGGQRTQADLYDSLTDTELRIIGWLAEGHSNKVISEKSHIAISTTKWHLRNIYDKLDAKNRTEAVHKAKLLRLLKP